MKQSLTKKNFIKTSIMFALLAIIAAACVLAPSGKTATPGDEELVVSWTLPATNAADHFVASATAPSDVGPYTCATATNLATSCTITGLTNGTEYEVDVVSMVYNADVPPVLVEVPHDTEPTILATPVGEPDAPTDVALTVGNTELAASWTAPVDDGGTPITGYTATATPGGATCSTSGATNCTLSGLTNGTEYTVTVTATNVVGEGPASVGASATPRTVPDPPTFGIAPVTISDGELYPNWEAPTNNGGAPITSYTATASPGGHTCTSTTETYCRIGGLTNGTEYTITVTATNVAGTSAPSEALVATPVGPPSAPRNVVLIPGNGTLRVEWDAPEDDGGSPITSYTVRLSPGAHECTTTETFCVFNGLANDTTYTATVTASNGYFDSTGAVDSDVVQAQGTRPTTAAPPTTPAPVVDQAGDDTTPETLAFTGNSSTLVVAAGLLLLVVGLLGRFVARRID